MCSNCPSIMNPIKSEASNIVGARTPQAFQAPLEGPPMHISRDWKNRFSPIVY